ncbi:hypothetical protein BF93_00585 [Brachybacterium phenoliresistens]|uniref:DUF2231 domain-containing protein n=1 Tax=Brachybacterium phenoliresistens TaxID=396014 RepID=Z9JS91_9MICO|nr:DUF2231 domain-containing protein [Brachybacterium phenoliresistens]EWS80898.1 hypothetical protein BF93_00585 [Brachybacterium phenoliresistens]
MNPILDGVMGLPMHPLVVHAVVVLVPLSALALVLGTLVPAARRRLGAVTPLLALLVMLLVPVTIASGEVLLGMVGPTPRVLEHARLARMLPPWTIAMAVVAAAQWAWYRWREEPGRLVPRLLGATAVVAAVGATTLVVMIGEAGARSVWGG